MNDVSRATTAAILVLSAVSASAAAAFSQASTEVSIRWLVAVFAAYLLPGSLVIRLLAAPVERGGPGALAIALVLSTAIVNLCALAALPFGATFGSALSAFIAVCVAAVVARVARHERGHDRPASRLEWGAFAFAVSVLLPLVWHFAGGAIDDWWDLSFVRALADRGRIDFAEPILGGGKVHPRFSWSSWLIAQAAVLRWTGVDPVATQLAWLAPLVCVATVSAVAGLARRVFGARANVRNALAVAAVPAWLLGTDALPFFVRPHQDKLVAAIVFVPVLLTATIAYLRRPSFRAATLFVLCAVATCSVHTLVFGVGGIGVLVCVMLVQGEPADGRAVRVSIGHRVVPVVVMAILGIYPAWQGWALQQWFAGQGVNLGALDNPVVRAHLALGRLVAADRPHLVVNPAAVFGPVGVLAGLGAVAALRRRHRGDRLLSGLTFVPAFMIFAPWLAARIGAIVVPWMLYRVGWLIPQALLIARAAPLGETHQGGSKRRAVLFLAYASVVALLVLPTFRDRVNRSMRERATVTERFPRGTTLDVYRFLDRSPLRGVVLAPAGLSNLVPALTGRPVAAFSERGTVVFDGDEGRAYRRLRDRADFLACDTSAEVREEIARRYGVEHAVFRKRWIPQGDEKGWIERATAEGALLAGEDGSRVPCFDGSARFPAHLPDGWSVVYDNADFAVVATDVSGVATRDVSGAGAGAGGGMWLDAFSIEPGTGHGSAELLGATSGFPGLRVGLAPVPLGLGIGSEIVWTSGPSTWDDGPSEVVIDVGLESPCDVTAVEVVPYLETRRREAFAIEVEGRATKAVARDGTPILIALDRRSRSEVRVTIRSMMGVAFGISELRVLGERASCAGGWKPLAAASYGHEAIPLASYLALQSQYPTLARLSSSLSRIRAEQGASNDALALLRRALQRDDAGSMAWIEYGLRLDAIGKPGDAYAAYRRARSLDSRSAWAHGCLAWSLLRRNAPMRAGYHAWRARRLDPRYADAWTIGALAAERLGLRSLSADGLEKGIELAPRRSWPYFERARQLVADGRAEDAKQLMRRYRRLVPGDEQAAEWLRSRGRADEGGAS